VQNARILVVEDDLLVAEDLRRHVTALGYDVVGVADSGEDAIQTAGALRPDLVLMDVRLSGHMDGLEAGSLIEESLGPVIIVYVTATPVLERMRYHVPKPFVASTLAFVIAEALDGNRRQGTL
jgi:CheY-like chemotaxis protein